jgi:hypothetical protein
MASSYCHCSIAPGIHMQSVSNDKEETLSLAGHRNPVLKYVACHFTDRAELRSVINCFYTFSRIAQDRGS